MFTLRCFCYVLSETPYVNFVIKYTMNQMGAHCVRRMYGVLTLLRYNSSNVTVFMFQMLFYINKTFIS